MDILDTYLTIAHATDGILFKEKNSKFFSYAYPVTTTNEVKLCLENLKKLHPTAGHFCYAYQIGTQSIQYRTFDDGEPNNSAGIPIFLQIQSYNLTQVLVVVVRYFGGTKLGVGGLISAYKTAAKLTLELAEIIEKTINIHFLVKFDYKNMNKVMRIIKEKNGSIISQKMNETCQIEIAVRKKNAKSIFDVFDGIFEVGIKEV